VVLLLQVKAFFSHKRKKLLKDDLAGYLFISPWIIGFLAFMAYPMILSLYYSLTNYNLFSPPVWIGLQNYIEIIKNDPKFLNSLKVTLMYVAASIPLRLVFALVLALLFYKASKMIDFYRAVYYIPSILGGSVAIAVIWRELFGYYGALNNILMASGLMEQRFSWIGNPNTALLTLIALAVWQFGSPMIIFLAGLKAIPVSLYESASIDGAGWWHKFYRITLPMLTPVIFFNLIMQIIRLFLIFTRAYIITGGGPMSKTEVYALYLFREGIRYHRFGYASALGWILLIVIAIITFIIFKTSNRWVYYETKGEL